MYTYINNYFKYNKYTQYILFSNNDKYTHINNFCHKIQCLFARELIHVVHELSDHLLCANRTYVSYLETVYN